MLPLGANNTVVIGGSRGGGLLGDQMLKGALNALGRPDGPVGRAMKIKLALAINNLSYWHISTPKPGD
jgi:hypothetical protein